MTQGTTETASSSNTNNSNPLAETALEGTARLFKLVNVAMQDLPQDYKVVKSMGKVFQQVPKLGNEIARQDSAPPYKQLVNAITITAKNFLLDKVKSKAINSLLGPAAPAAAVAEQMGWAVDKIWGNYFDEIGKQLGENASKFRDIPASLNEIELSLVMQDKEDILIEYNGNPIVTLLNWSRFNEWVSEKIRHFTEKEVGEITGNIGKIVELFPKTPAYSFSHIQPFSNLIEKQTTQLIEAEVLVDSIGNTLAKENETFQNFATTFEKFNIETEESETDFKEPYLPQRFVLAIEKCVNALISLQASKAQNEAFQEANKEFVRANQRLKEIADLEIKLDQYRDAKFIPQAVYQRLAVECYTKVKKSITENKNDFLRLINEVNDIKQKIKQRQLLGDELLKQIEHIQAKKEQLCKKLTRLSFDQSLAYAKTGTQMLGAVASLANPVVGAAIGLTSLLFGFNEAKDQAKQQKRARRLQEKIGEQNTQEDYKNSIRAENSNTIKEHQLLLGSLENEILQQANTAPPKKFRDWLDVKIKENQTNLEKHTPYFAHYAKELNDIGIKKEGYIGQIKILEAELKAVNKNDTHKIKHLEKVITNLKADLANCTIIETELAFHHKNWKDIVEQDDKSIKAFEAAKKEEASLAFINDWYYETKCEKVNEKYKGKKNKEELEEADRIALAKLNKNENEWYEAFKLLNGDTHQIKDCISAAKTIASALQRWQLEKPALALEFADHTFEAYKILQSLKDPEFGISRLVDLYNKLGSIEKAYNEFGKWKQLLTEIVNPSLNLVGLIINMIGILAGAATENPVITYMQQQFKELYAYFGNVFQKLYEHQEKNFKLVNEKLDSLYDLNLTATENILNIKWQIVHLQQQLNRQEQLVKSHRNVLLWKQHADFSAKVIKDYRDNVNRKIQNIEDESIKFSSHPEQSLDALDLATQHAMDSLYATHQIKFDAVVINISLRPQLYIGHLADKLGQNAKFPNFKILYAAVYAILKAVDKATSDNKRAKVFRPILKKFSPKLIEIKNRSKILEAFLEKITNPNSSLLIKQIEKMQAKYRVLLSKIATEQTIQARELEMKINGYYKDAIEKSFLLTRNTLITLKETVASDNSEFVGSSRYYLNELFNSELGLIMDHGYFKGRRAHNLAIKASVVVFIFMLPLIKSVKDKRFYKAKKKSFFLQSFREHVANNFSAIQLKENPYISSVYFFDLKENKIMISTEAVRFQYEFLKELDASSFLMGGKVSPIEFDNMQGTVLEDFSPEKYKNNSDNYPVVISSEEKEVNVYIYGKKATLAIPTSAYYFSSESHKPKNLEELDKLKITVAEKKQAYDKSLKDYINKYVKLILFYLDRKQLTPFQFNLNGIDIPDGILIQPIAEQEHNLFPLVFPLEYLNKLKENYVIKLIYKVEENKRGKVICRYSFLKQNNAECNYYSLSLNYYLITENNSVPVELCIFSKELARFDVLTVESVKKVVAVENGYTESHNYNEFLLIALYGSPNGTTALMPGIAAQGSLDVTGHGAIFLTELPFKGLVYILKKLPINYIFNFNHELYDEKNKVKLEDFIAGKINLESLEHFIEEESDDINKSLLDNLINFASDPFVINSELLRNEYDEILIEYEALVALIKLVADIDYAYATQLLKQHLNIDEPVVINRKMGKNFKESVDFITDQGRLSVANIKPLLDDIKDKPSRLIQDLKTMSENLDACKRQIDNFVVSNGEKIQFFNLPMSKRWKPKSKDTSKTLTLTFFPNPEPLANLNEDSLDEINNEETENKHEIKQYGTKGEGDCAFHAALGKIKNDLWVCEDVVTQRKKVADAIKKMQKGELFYHMVLVHIETMFDEGARFNENRLNYLSKVRKNFNDFKEADNKKASEAWTLFERELKKHQSIIDYIHQNTKEHNKINLKNMYEVCKNEMTGSVLIEKINKTSLKTHFEKYERSYQNTCLPFSNFSLEDIATIQRCVKDSSASANKDLNKKTIEKIKNINLENRDWTPIKFDLVEVYCLYKFLASERKAELCQKILPHHKFLNHLAEQLATDDGKKAIEEYAEKIIKAPGVYIHYTELGLVAEVNNICIEVYTKRSDGTYGFDALHNKQASKKVIVSHNGARGLAAHYERMDVAPNVITENAAENLPLKLGK